MLVEIKALRTRSRDRVSKGVYIMKLDYRFNFDNYLEDKGVGYASWYDQDNEYSFTPYGVCDGYEQILGKYPQIVESKDQYVVSLTKVQKIGQPVNNGWRWCKWGEYIGIQEPNREYIYDEPDIEEVYVYEIYKIK